jgi:hypothetical protein
MLRLNTVFQICSPLAHTKAHKTHEMPKSDERFLALDAKERSLCQVRLSVKTGPTGFTVYQAQLAKYL